MSNVVVSVVKGLVKGIGVGVVIVGYVAFAFWTIGLVTNWGFGDGNWIWGTIAFCLGLIFWVCATGGIIKELFDTGILN